jgi:hypothetical protein
MEARVGEADKVIAIAAEDAARKRRVEEEEARKPLEKRRVAEEAIRGPSRRKG